MKGRALANLEKGLKGRHARGVWDMGGAPLQETQHGREGDQGLRGRYGLA